MRYGLKSIQFLLVVFLMTLSHFAFSEGLVLGEYKGTGSYKDTNLNINDCSVAVNARYNEDTKIFSYDYAYLCMSELSYPVRAPSNDYSFQLKVDENDQLFLIKKDGKLAGPVGTKNGSEFNFSLDLSSVVKVKYIPMKELREYLAKEYLYCPFTEEKVQMKRIISYRFILGSDKVRYERKSQIDMLPFFFTKECFEKNAAELNKYQVLTDLAADLNKRQSN